MYENIKSLQNVACLKKKIALVINTSKRLKRSQSDWHATET